MVVDVVTFCVEENNDILVDTSILLLGEIEELDTTLSGNIMKYQLSKPHHPCFTLQYVPR